MPMKNNLNQRSERLAKRRKTNTVLNSLIAIVIILILIVSYRIFFSSSEPGQKSDQVVKQEPNHPNDQNSSGTVNKDEDKDKEQQEDTNKKDDNQDKEDKEDDEKDKDKDKDDEKIVEKSDETNVESTIVDPSWEAVGTEQSNGHQYSSSMDSLDWKEKEQALSYATDIPVDNMVIWWLERGPEGDHQAIGTISPTDAQSEVYRVHLEWEDGKGWKPVIVKKLISNDKRP